MTSMLDLKSDVDEVRWQLGGALAPRQAAWALVANDRIAAPRRQAPSSKQERVNVSQAPTDRTPGYYEEQGMRTPTVCDEEQIAGRRSPALPLSPVRARATLLPQALAGSTQHRRPVVDLGYRGRVSWKRASRALSSDCRPGERQLSDVSSAR